METKIPNNGCWQISLLFPHSTKKMDFPTSKIKCNYCRNWNVSGSFNIKCCVLSCLIITPVIIFPKINYNNITFLKNDSTLNMHSVETSGDVDGDVCVKCWEETSRDRTLRLWGGDAGPGRQREKSQVFYLFSVKPHPTPGRPISLEQATCVVCHASTGSQSGYTSELTPGHRHLVGFL